ncbi:hypothetical protein [Jeotgalibacillus proteolyticus]|uniref:hypothetical protein n=1 Tax=Jeotgalibacillus proteolyticus TaxID=2082395 RepID=UPI001FD6BDD8|nr:hypothetical protein [Jeotgalibacillus proteolyticus]
MTPEQLLDAYKSLWKNRLLNSKASSLEILSQSIKRELLDELTHPRVRKSPEEKYILAVERIITSSLDREEKIELIHFFTELHRTIREGEE